MLQFNVLSVNAVGKESKGGTNEGRGGLHEKAKTLGLNEGLHPTLRVRPRRMGHPGKWAG